MIGEFLLQITTALEMQRDTLDFRYIEHWVAALELREQWQALRSE